MRHKKISICITFFFYFSIFSTQYAIEYVATHTPASPVYQQTVHNFLHHLKVENADQIPIYLIIEKTVELAQEEANNKPSACKLGFATSAGIWLNEQDLEQENIEEQLFVMAHESAHYALKHAQHIANNKAAWNTFITLSSLFSGYISFYYLRKTPILDQFFTFHKTPGTLSTCVQGIKTIIAAGFTYRVFSKSKNRALQRLQIYLEEQADKIATYLLCDLGHEEIIEQRIENLAIEINNGNGEWSDGFHPTILQEYNYLKKYYQLWITEYATQKNIA